MDMEKLEEFLRQMVPSVQELMKINMELAGHVSGTVELAGAVKADLQHSEILENAVRTLSESVEALGKPVAELIESVNRSNRLMEEQNRLFAAFKDTVMLNNSRMNVLNMALAAQTDDPGLMEQDKE